MGYSAVLGGEKCISHRRWMRTFWEKSSFSGFNLHICTVDYICIVACIFKIFDVVNIQAILYYLDQKGVGLTADVSFFQ